LKIEGIEKIPDNEKVILTSNHIGYLDGFLILSMDKIAYHPNLVVIVAEKYAQITFYRWAVKILNWMFIDRYNPDIKTMREVLKRMRNKSLLVIAPEGTRSPNATLIEGKPGAAYIAAKTEAKIVPITITGYSDKVYKKHLKQLKKLDINIKIGDPYKLPPLPRDDRDVHIKSATDEIMCRIAAQLPVSYRGIYTDHPRLKELLEESS
ncbi:lysophospholipid acyltransferase family protein, partial [Chloroflexota bacterium]